MLLKTQNFKSVNYSFFKLLISKFKKSDSLIFHVSKLIHITINRGLGKFSENKAIHKLSINEFRLISGQQPKVIYSKKSIAGFKLREKSLIGLKVTLRKERMYSFLDRLINLALPQISDFKGLLCTNFDSFGNYNFGILDQSIFPEIVSETIPEQLGFNVTFVFYVKNKKHNLTILKTLGFPFSEKF